MRRASSTSHTASAAGVVSKASLVRRLRLVSPRHRQWQRLLDSCVVDPDRTSLGEIGERDVIICGHSRSGTALATAALWHPPTVITVMEPWDCFRMAPHELFASIRSEIGDTGLLSRGRLDVRALDAERAVRWQRDGERAVRVDVRHDTVIGVKMPAFWRYLPLLPSAKFVVCLRDPVEVVSSYGTAGGRLSRGLDYDIPFNARMNDELTASTADTLVRRVKMFDYVARRMLPHLANDNVHVVRYEDWSADPQSQLDRLAGVLGVDSWPLAVDIRSARSRTVDAAVVDAVVRHCETARELGYEPSRWLDPGAPPGGDER